MRVLLVEDSPRLQQVVSLALRRSGFAVDVSGDGEDGLWRARSNDYDVVILDIMLPKLDGLSVLRTLHAEGRQAPVLLLTAKDSVEDRVRGLKAGADDYLVKPFSLDELIARVEVLCRRKYAVKSTRIAVGDLTLDTAAKKAERAGRALDLTAREYALLEYLANRKGSVVSRSEIEEHIYDGLVDPMSNVVDSAICILRRKLGAAGEEALIHTRRGQGYVLQAEESR